MSALEAISSQEMLALLSARLIHSLSNQLSVVTGNLFVAARLQDRPAECASALQSALLAANDAGALLTRMADYRRSLQLERGTMPLESVAQLLRDWCAGLAGWTITVERLEPKGSLPVTPRLLNFVLQAIAGKIVPERAAVRLRPGRATPLSPQGTLLLVISSRAGIDWETVRTDLADVTLATAYEILSSIEAGPRSSSGAADEHCTSIEFPLAL